MFHSFNHKHVLSTHSMPGARMAVRLQWWMRKVKSSSSSWSLESSGGDRQVPRRHNLGFLMLKEINRMLWEMMMCIMCGQAVGCGDDCSHCGQGNLPKETRLWVRLEGSSQGDTSGGVPQVERTAGAIPKAGKNTVTSTNWKVDVRLVQARRGWGGVGAWAGRGGVGGEVR